MPPPVPAPCQALQDDIDALETTIAEERELLNVAPVRDRPGWLAAIKRHQMELSALKKLMQQCLLNATPFALRIDGIEVTQSIQSMFNDVPLVAGKKTIVRVYLSWLLPRAIAVTGQLSAGFALIPSLNQAVLDPSLPSSLSDRRNDLARSLNFLLPEAQAAAGTLALRLSGTTNVADGTPLSLANPADNSWTATFDQSAPLRVRLIRLRYKFVPPDGTTPETFVASDFDIQMIVSWLGRAYPVPNVISSNVITDSNFAPPFSADQINTQVAAIRKQDMILGADNRTHYFGLVGDGNRRGFWMRGKSAVPGSPDPTAVGSGPTGSADYGWDFDGCYGDWYTGHELGHTFGRNHPGSGCCETADDPGFPFPAGQLSDASNNYVGLDVGDASKGLPMTALPGTSWHDVMTYCNFQWICSYTYQGIHDRINAENIASGGGAPDRRYPERPALKVESNAPSFMHVVALVNVTRSTGKLEHIAPVPRGPEDGVTPNSIASIRFVGADSKLIAAYPAHLKPFSTEMHGEDRITMIDATVPLPSRVGRLELAINGEVVDQRSPAKQAPRVQNLRAQPVAGSHLLEWDSAEAKKDEYTYMVYASTDQGKTWSTLAVGLRSPEFHVDKSQFAGASDVMIRVVATDGFSSSTVETQQLHFD